MKLKIIFGSRSEKSGISRRAQIILYFINSERLKINSFGSEHSKITTAQAAN